MDFNKLKEVYGKMRDAKTQHDDLSSKYKANIAAVEPIDSAISCKSTQTGSDGPSATLPGRR